MLLKFLQAAHIGKKSYPVGVHEVNDEETLSSKFLAKLVNAGLVQEYQGAPPVAFVSLQDRQKKLAEILVQRAKKPQPPAEPEVMPSVSSGPPKPAALDASPSDASSAGDDGSAQESPAGESEAPPVEEAIPQFKSKKSKR